MSRALALLLSLCALVLPSIARAHGRVDVRVPARASGAGEASARSRVGSPEFLQRDPEGYADSVNQYAALANDPINHRDPTGRRVNVSGVEPSDLLELLVQLEAITGLTLGVCSADELANDACQTGDLVARGQSSSGSRLASDILLDAIEDPSEIRFGSKNASEVGFGSHMVGLNYPGEPGPRSRTGYNFADGEIELDFYDFGVLSGSPELLRSRSVGLTFFHELLHTVVTGSYRDDSDLGIQYTTLGDPRSLTDSQPGPVETIVNDIRRQLRLPTRLKYFEEPGKEEGQQCLRFSTGLVCWEARKVDR